MNGSTKLKSVSPRSKEPDPIDEMRAAIEDGREASKLLAYSADFDEDTGRTEVTVNLQQPSQPEIKVSEPDKPGAIHVVLTVVRKFPAWGSVIVALAALAAYVYLQTR